MFSFWTSHWGCMRAYLEAGRGEMRKIDCTVLGFWFGARNCYLLVVWPWAVDFISLILFTGPTLLSHCKHCVRWYTRGAQCSARSHQVFSKHSLLLLGFVTSVLKAITLGKEIGFSTGGHMSGHRSTCVWEYCERAAWVRFDFMWWPSPWEAPHSHAC